MAAENIGWRLENVVYIELLRKCANEFLDVYDYKPGPKDREVAFVVCEKKQCTGTYTGCLRYRFPQDLQA